MALVRPSERGERLADRHAGLPGDRQRAVGTVDLEEQPRFEIDTFDRNALVPDFRPRCVAERRPQLRKPCETGGVELGFDGALPEGAQVRDSHPVSRQHAGERMDQYRVDAERIGDLTGMLAGRAAEARQRESRHVVTALHGNLLDGVRHAFHGDAQEPGRERLGRDTLAARLGKAFGERRELAGRARGVDRFVGVRPERGREEVGLNPAEKDVRVGYGQRAAVAVAGGARERAGRFGADLQPPGREPEDRAAAGRDRVDAHHRRRDAYAGDDGRRCPFVAFVEQRDVGRGPAHVEADDPGIARGGCRRRHADDAAGRARKHAVLAAEMLRLDQAAMALHEEYRRVAETLFQSRRQRIDVAFEHRREVGVDERGIAARHDLHERTDPMRHRDLAEADAFGDLGNPSFMPGKRVAVQEHDGDAVESRLAGGLKIRRDSVLVERHDDFAVGGEAFVGLDDAAVEHFRQLDVEREDVGPLLRADPDRVLQARRRDEHRRFAAPLEQRVRADRRAHPDRDGGVRRRRCIEKMLDAGQRRVAVTVRIVRQQLDGAERPVRRDRNDVGERPAAIDQKLPGRVLCQLRQKGT